MRRKATENSELFKFGIGVFETIKIYKGIPILLKEHLDRMYNSVKELNIEINIPYEELEKKVYEYVKNYDYKALRITVFDEGYNFMIRDIPYKDEDYNRGYKLNIAPIRRGKSFIYRHKTANYFENIYLKRLALRESFDESLIVNTDEKILEGTMTNIFFIRGNKVFTPELSLNILPGIMRKEVIKTAKNIGIEVNECIIDIGDLSKFDFAFITNSLMDVLRVREIGDITYDEDNEIFYKLRAALEEKFYECFTNR
ncbi:aminotransferase class IV [Caloranaerobacter azorensis]|uniref:Aminotransferase class IV n=1 Tax=Caloranaerobacter azorensis TaxID=116090 RepID=A0A6P1YDV7_9FIRM|nr:aminotransferase class IV [Caloranaerobacter azorensis]QIB27411.1 aminotransferase class IV [Caloranaerobacter azorensis]